MGDHDDTGYDPRPKKTNVVGLNAGIRKFIESRPDGTLALNLGCGQTRMPGVVNVDWLPDDAVDVTCDLFASGWPFDDDSVGFVYMSHFLEHVPWPQWKTLWDELWRICADNARIMIMSPHARSDRYLQDPSHCQPILDRKFLYLGKKWRTENKLNNGYYGGKDVNFLMDIRSWKIWHQDYAMREDRAKEWAELHENNVLDDCVWFLQAFKTDASLETFLRKIDEDAQGRLISGKPVEGA